MIREEETKTKKKRRDVSRTKTTKKKNNSSTPASSSSSSSSSTFARKLSLKKLCASSSLSLSLVWNNRSLLLVCERFLFSVLNPKSNFLFPFFLSFGRISLQILYIKQCAYAQTRRVIQSSRAGESFQRETEKERERESVCVCVCS